jgi:hypothetical protein
MRNIGARVALAATVTVGALVLAGTAGAAVQVTPTTSLWTQDDTRPGGAVSWTSAWGAPAGLGSSSLQLTTDATTTSKAGLYAHFMAGTPLKRVSRLSYWTYQSSPPTIAHGDASYQLQIDVDGTLGDGQGFTTLVYEPYQNGPQLIVPNVWQKWDVAAGQFWSSRNAGPLVAGAGGAPFYTLATVNGLAPNAVVVGVGVNIGSNNPSYVVATDGVQLNNLTFDFERPRAGDDEDDEDDDDRGEHHGGHDGHGDRGSRGRHDG